MTMVDPARGWFESFGIPTFDIDEVMGVNDEYIHKSSVMVSQLFNNTWLYGYPRPRKLVFDNISKFK